MDSSKSFISLFSLLIVLGMISSSSATATAATKVSGATKELDRIDVGGFNPIKDLTDPYLVKIASFAVAVHNKYSPDELEFVKLVKGESQIVNGINYRLTFYAKYGAGAGYFQAVVYDHSQSWTLTSFAKLLGKV